MRVLIDTNIILDYFLEREPFVQDAEALFNAINSGQVVGYVTATTLTDIFIAFTPLILLPPTHSLAELLGFQLLPIGFVLAWAALVALYVATAENKSQYWNNRSKW